jgi:hypothetical protein
MTADMCETPSILSLFVICGSVAIYIGFVAFINYWFVLRDEKQCL